MILIYFLYRSLCFLVQYGNGDGMRTRNIYTGQILTIFFYFQILSARRSSPRTSSDTESTGSICKYYPFYTNESANFQYNETR